MEESSVKEELLQEIDKLSPEQQQRVSEFTRRLRRSQLPPARPARCCWRLREN